MRFIVANKCLAAAVAAAGVDVLAVPFEENGGTAVARIIPVVEPLVRGEAAAAQRLGCARTVAVARDATTAILLTLQRY